MMCLISAVLLLSACSGSGNDIMEQPAENMSYYRSTQGLSDNMTAGETEGYAYCGSSDRLFFVSYLNGDDENDARSGYYLNSIRSDGSEPQTRHMTDRSICVPDFLGDETGYYVSSVYDEGCYYLVKTDGEGNDVSSVRLDINDDDRNFYVRGVCVSDSGVYVNCYDSVYYFDFDGNLKNVLTDGSMNIQRMARGASGAVYVCSFGDNGYELKKLDGERGTITDIPVQGIDSYSMDAYPINGCGDTELFYTDGTSVYSFDPETGMGDELFNWFDSGVSIMEVSAVFPSGDGFVCGGTAYPSGKPSVYRIYEADEKPAEKKELVLAGDENSIDAYIRARAVSFNRTDGEYRLSVKMYPSDDNSSLNMDMLSGKNPDILMTGTETPVESYISKGIFADMYEFIDSDSEINRDDFLPNLLRASETDGHLYTFADRFKLFTVLGKTSVFGNKTGITFDRLEEITAQMPAGTEIFPGSSKNNILNYAMYMSGDRFVDMRNGTCSFTSDYFIKLLEYANGYMDSVDTDSYFDDSFWNRYSTMFADGSAVLLISYLTDYTDFYALEHENFGEKATAVGFPTDSGAGSAFEIDTGFAISASGDTEGAWRFVRTLLLPDHQDNIDSFPVRADSLEKRAAQAMEHDSERIYQPIAVMGDMWLASGASDIGEADREDIDKVNAAILSAETIYRSDQTISNIITEESGRYFAGAITSQQAAEAIQSRVGIYLSESR